jgi:hypothetical protein
MLTYYSESVVIHEEKAHKYLNHSLAHPKVYALIHLPHCACHPRSREKELANIVNLGTIILEMNLTLWISILPLRSRLYGPGIS